MLIKLIIYFHAWIALNRVSLTYYADYDSLS